MPSKPDAQPAETRGLTYADSGVDIDAGDRAVAMMQAAVRRTHGPRVMGELGGFAGMFRLDFNEKLFKGTKGSRAYSEHVVIQCFALYFFGTCLNLCGFLGYSVLQPGESSTPHSLRKPHGYALKY